MAVLPVFPDWFYLVGFGLWFVLGFCEKAAGRDRGTLRRCVGCVYEPASRDRVCAFRVCVSRFLTPELHNFRQYDLTSTTRR